MNTPFLESFIKYDLHASEDSNIKNLIANKGVESYGYYWIIVEKLYQNGINGISEPDIKAMAWTLHVDTEKINSMLSAMVDEGLLFKGSQDQPTYYSRRVLATIEKMTQQNATTSIQKSEAGKKSGEARRQNSKKLNTCSTPVQHVSKVLNQIREDKSRLDKSRQEEMQEEQNDDVSHSSDEETEETDEVDEVETAEQPSHKDLHISNNDFNTLIKKWGSVLVDDYLQQLQTKVDSGEWNVPSNGATNIEGMLLRDEAKGLIHKPAPPSPPNLYNNGTCPHCGQRLDPGNKCAACGKFWETDKYGKWHEYDLADISQLVSDPRMQRFLNQGKEAVHAD